MLYGKINKITKFNNFSICSLRPLRLCGELLLKFLSPHKYFNPKGRFKETPEQGTGSGGKMQEKR